MESRYTKKDLDNEARRAVKQFSKENKRKAKLDRWELVLGRYGQTLQVYILSEYEFEDDNGKPAGMWTYCWNIAI